MCLQRKVESTEMLLFSHLVSVFTLLLLGGDFDIWDAFKQKYCHYVHCFNYPNCHIMTSWINDTDEYKIVGKNPRQKENTAE